MRCSYALAVGVTVALGIVVPQRVVAQAKGTETALATIFADWKHRQGAMKAARYVVTGTTEFKDPERPAGNPIQPRRTVLILDLMGKRYRLETSEQIIRALEGGERKFIPRVSTSAYNGKVGQGYLHRELNGIEEDGPDLIYTNQTVDGTGFDAHLYPVLYAHGLVPTVQTHVRMDRLPPRYDPDDFQVRGRQLFHRRNCTVVQTDPTAGHPPTHDELWIDPSQGSAVHRYVQFAGSDPWYRLDTEWKQTAFGWLPDKWTLTWSKKGKVRRVHRLTIESFEPNPAVTDSDFNLPAKPEMKVSVSEPVPPDSGLNPYLPANKTYLVLPSGSWKEVGAKGFTTRSGKELPPDHRRAWAWWAAATAATLLVVVAGYRFHRRRPGAAA